MKLVITDIEDHGGGIKSYRLANPHQADLSPYGAGAHLRLCVQDDGKTYERHYSLCGDPRDSKHYRIAVLCVEEGRGGSRLIHQRFAVGLEVEVQGPFQSFPVPTVEGEVLLLAGGIGVTPLLSMAYEFHRRRRPFSMHYAVRSEDRLAFAAEIQTLSPKTFRTYVQTEGQRMDLSALIHAHAGQGPIVTCGPSAFLAAARAAANAAGVGPTAFGFESFGVGHRREDRPVQLHLAYSAKDILVLPGTSILDALIAADVFTSYECRRGDCGQCATAFTGGEPEHRDQCLSPEIRTTQLCTCVSWARTDSLTLLL